MCARGRGMVSLMYRGEHRERMISSHEGQPTVSSQRRQQTECGAFDESAEGVGQRSSSIITEDVADSPANEPRELYCESLRRCLYRRSEVGVSASVAMATASPREVLDALLDAVLGREYELDADSLSLHFTPDRSR